LIVIVVSGGNLVLSLGDEIFFRRPPKVRNWGGGGDSLYLGAKCWLNGSLLANCMV